MEWISFNLDNDKKTDFEKILLPTLWKTHGSLLEMSGLSWAAYRKQTEQNSYHYLFCSDSVLFMKFIKAYVVDFTREFAVPNTSTLIYLGPENIND